MNFDRSDIYLLTHGITITKRATQDVWEEIMLTGRDIEDWIDHCEDEEMLRYLGSIALKKARRLKEPDDDDFRSRA